ncbi:MAG: ECF-type sigma factor [Nannocystaceae bacterium]
MSDLDQSLESEGLDTLFRALYSELKRLARAQRRAVGGEPGTASIVHEAWARLARSQRDGGYDRQHFLALAARVMRQVVVDHARTRARVKRGGLWKREALDGDLAGVDREAAEILAIDQALNRLADRDPEMVRLVELKFFAGLSELEIAEIMQLSTRTVRRRWQQSVDHLQRELRS